MTQNGFRSGRGLVLGLAVLFTACLGGLMIFRRPGSDPNKELKASPPDSSTQTADSANPPGKLLAQADTTKSVAKPAAKGPSYLKDWKDPAVVFLCSGELQGYLEPCGCSERQLGGFGRRMQLVDILRHERKWNVACVDVGGDANFDRINREQTKLKFATYRRVLHKLGYIGMALGQEELLLKPDALFTLKTTEEAENCFVPYISANTVVFGDRSIGFPVDYVVSEVGGKKLGVTSIVGNSRKTNLAHFSPDELKITDPKAVLPGVIQALNAAKVDIKVLLAHADEKESAELAKAFPQFQIVVNAGGFEDPRLEPEMIGDTLHVYVGRKGKHAMVVGWFPNQKPALRMELVDLDKDNFPIPDLARTMMQDYVTEVTNSKADAGAEMAHPLGAAAEFVGAEECKGCHSKAFAQWSGTKHAKAMQSLKTGRPHEPWIDRSKDPECLACHVVGWNPQEAIRYPTGFKSEEETPLLIGQQCENCHGPGGAHVKLESGSGTPAQAEAARKALHLTKAGAFQSVCKRCHDHDNSPTFDEKTYESKFYKEIDHAGLKD